MGPGGPYYMGAPKFYDTGRPLTPKRLSGHVRTILNIIVVLEGEGV
jgi:hypothetical protein